MTPDGNLENWLREVDERGRLIAERVSQLETWHRDMQPFIEQRGVDIEALKEASTEQKATQRLNRAIGALGGSLLISLLAFIATRGA
jgi:phage shock protein A